ncbi:hypothetical protein H6P81_021178 [Aristolochia fimbriata]|uniref:Uncharacterized protein n=1 Tax=Aristolochia fimbriata TaxID=158543 RepID=A0AAV7DS48_ARIFI|nr:hypothetical protein H6P81_021169 [Aristolochia fimbriata]KAG9438880.1 hypothetical protein H6P81_021178 [Aristolochia fimbriata]
MKAGPFPQRAICPGDVYNAAGIGAALDTLQVVFPCTGRGVATVDATSEMKAAAALTGILTLAFDECIRKVGIQSYEEILTQFPVGRLGF